MRRTHVLLDLDGTLSNSLPGIARSMQYAFAECGHEPPTDDAVRAVIGPPLEVSFPILGIPVTDVTTVVAKYRERYNDIGLFENELYEGVPEMLDALLATGVDLALATAKPEAIARRITAHFDVARHFVFEAGASPLPGDSRRSKDQVITYCLGELGIDPGDHVVMVGDRDHDVEGALANGIDCVGVAWGFGSTDELVGAGAAAVAHHPADVVALI